MAVAIPDEVRVLLEGPNLAFVATVDAAGSPCVQPTLIGIDGDDLLLNTQEGRIWPQRLRRTGRIAIAVANGTDPQEYVELRGHLVGDTTDGAKENIDELSRVYLGTDYPHHFDGEVRVLFRIGVDWLRYVNLGTGARLAAG